MYIKKIKLKNIRCFKDETTIDLSSDNGDKNWAVILGDNGTGKTTLLRSIALGLCDEDNAIALLKDLGSDLITQGKDTATIEVKLESKDKKQYDISIRFGKTGHDSETITKYLPDENNTTFPWNDLFVCGYGANRGIDGSDEPAEYYQVSDAVYTLINYDWTLLDQEIQYYRITAGDNDIEKNIQKAKNVNKKKHLLREKRERLIGDLLKEILMLPEEKRIAFTNKGIRIREGNVLDLPLSTWGDGYQATLTWILDLLGRFLQKNLSKKLEDVFPGDKEKFKNQLRGIVLIDEIEQHLHPKWQKEIVPRLAKQFPNLQFIISTHSPVVAINTFKTRQDDPNSKLYYLEKKESYSTISEVQESINELTYKQVLESEAFGHITNPSNKVEELLNEMSELASIDNPTNEQKLILDKIKKELKQLMFPSGRTLIEREVEREYYKELEKKADYLNSILKGKNDKDK